MLDRQLIAAIAADGIPDQDAEDMAKRVFAAMLGLLMDGRTVGIPNVGRLAPSKPKVSEAGFPPGMLRERVKVQLRNSAFLREGEPYADPNPSTKKRSTYGSRY